jgi:hypothetical protein
MKSKIFATICIITFLHIVVFSSAIWAQNTSQLKVELVSVSSEYPKNEILSIQQELEGNLSYIWLDGETNQTKITSVDTKGDGKKAVTISLVLTNETGYPASMLHAKRSPSGSHFAFGYGAIMDNYSWYELFVLDTQTSKIQSLGVASYKEYFWSPDGRFLSYIQNGDIQGNIKDEKYPLQLNVYDTVSLDIHPIISSNFLANSFCWSAPHDLYYAIPEHLPVKQTSDTHNSKLRRPRPNLYKYVIETKKATLLFRDCYRPVISDDGIMVAFYGEENPQSQTQLPPQWQYRANYMTLCVSELNGKNRKAINMHHGDYPLLQWSASGKSIITLREIVPGPNAQMEIVQWNTKSGYRERLLTLNVNDGIAENYGEATNRPEITRRFVFLGRYENHDKLIVSSKRYVELTKSALKMETVINQVDLDKGISEQVIVAKQPEGAYTPMSWVYSTS